MSDVNTNKFGGALLFILGEFAVAEDEMIEDGGMEVFGEDDQGREGSCEVSINELAQAASDEIKHLTEQLAKANERVKELENCNFDVMAAQAIEQAYLIANAFPKDKAILEALSSVREGATGKLNKFAIEKKIEAVVFYGERLKEIGFSGVDSYTDQVKEMLRKEQNQ